MLKWSHQLHIGEGVPKRKRRMKRRLEQGKLVLGVYLITEPSNQENLFDILDAKELLFPYNKRRTIVVYGLAKGKGEAEQMVTEMIEEVYRETGTLNVREYFLRE